jgi:hypothetical protein
MVNNKNVLIINFAQELISLLKKNKISENKELPTSVENKLDRLIDDYIQKWGANNDNKY